MKPKISVVLAVYNSMPYLKYSVESVLNQTFEDFEFIIVDDGSTDKSTDYIWSLRDNRIKFYLNKFNVGLTRSLSRAMQYVNAPFIARIDADDISESHRLMFQKDYMIRNNLTLTGSDAWIIDDNLNKKSLKKRLSTYNDIQFYAMLNNPFMHTSVMFKKECYDALNGYNNRIRYAQDYHLWVRWIQKFKAGNISETLVKWRQSRKGISTLYSASQKKYADKICLSYIRSVYPELSCISDTDIIAMRNGKYNRNNIVNIDKIFDTAMNKFYSSYTQNWVECYKIRTQHLRG